MITRSKSSDPRGAFKIPPPPKPPDPQSANNRTGRNPSVKRGANSDLNCNNKQRRVVKDNQNNNNMVISDNEFDVLPLDDDGSSLFSQVTNATHKDKASKKPSLPPLVIHNLTISEIINITKEANISQDKFRLQLTQHGTKLFAQTNDVFSGLKLKLTQKNVNFFTFATAEEKMDKFVLYGLPKLEPDEIIKELNSLRLFPNSVSLMNLKQQRHVNHFLYLVCFPKKEHSVTLTQLQQLRGLFAFVVKWRRFQARSQGLAQCSNCQSFGHASRNCHMPSTCVKCAANHKSAECIHNDPSTKKVPDSVLKCKNCGGNHSARYKDCQKRIEFGKLREAMKPQARKSVRKAAPSYLEQDYHHQFPLIRRPIDSNQTPVQPQQAPMYSAFLKKPEAPDTNLYSPQECFQIFQELYSSLINCKSKNEQIYTITNFTFKYLESAASLTNETNNG